MKSLLILTSLIISGSLWAKAEMCVNYLWEEFEKHCPQTNVKFITMMDGKYDMYSLKIYIRNKDMNDRYISMKQAGFGPEKIESLTKKLEDTYQCPKVSIKAGYRDVSYSPTALPDSNLKYLMDEGYTSGGDYDYADCGFMLNNDMYLPKWGIDKHYD